MSLRLRQMFGPLLMRRLYLQIYLTIIASLVLVVILSSLLWEFYGREEGGSELLQSISELVSVSLPEKDADAEEQQKTITRLGEILDLEIFLFDENRQLIAFHGDPEMPPERHAGQTGWFPTREGPILSLALPDGRWVVADIDHRPGPRPVLNLLFMLALIAVCVGIGVYPVARKLTKRLEHLERGVERIGSGDLKARVKV